MKLSIIIPTLNESVRIGSLIRYLKNCLIETEYEIIIADGGSDDGTITLAENSGISVVECDSTGRAAQMNRGAKEADGDILYFLHADSLPPKNFSSAIQGAVQTGTVAGCFRLAFDDPHSLLRIYSWFTRFDIDLFRFGDQSLFIKKSFFHDINGFGEHLKVMEDQEIVKRIKSKGGEFTILKDAVVTSARKYRSIGVIRLQIIFMLIVILYYCGASQEVLVHLYRSFVQTHPLSPSLYRKSPGQGVVNSKLT